MTHVANGDMVTLALIQGVVNTFVIFLSRIVGNIVDRVDVPRQRRPRRRPISSPCWCRSWCSGILATIIVMWFSRQREFRADAGGARLAGRERMIAALERLKVAHDAPLPAQLEAFGISGGEGGGLQRLFMSHPPLEERIAALRRLAAN